MLPVLEDRFARRLERLLSDGESLSGSDRITRVSSK
jgi:hypothetical protein